MLEVPSETATIDFLGTTPVAQYRNEFWDRIGEHDAKLRGRIQDTLEGLSGADDMKKAVLQSLERLESTQMSASERATLDFVKQQFLTVSEGNEDRVRSKIESSVQNTMTELTFKVTNKLNQGFEKLLSSQ
ncbi:hypothetical protein [uncultured Tateyamaria sp.]|uniref:hypothetical protein n=1 Tax=uncultured Tateyamaria sp. TaxID=455651 RepID=UPI002604DBF6|nr:hypothetical protein [uncultured Tateyamaria sp.]